MVCLQVGYIHIVTENIKKGSQTLTKEWKVPNYYSTRKQLELYQEIEDLEDLPNNFYIFQ